MPIGSRWHDIDSLFRGGCNLDREFRSQTSVWATTNPDALALGALTANWAVSEVKAKPLEAGK